MISFQQLMIFTRQKNALMEELNTEFFVTFDPSKGRIVETDASEGEKEALELIKSIVPLCVTIDQLMTLRYCLLAERLLIMYGETKRPFKPPSALLSKGTRLDFEHDARWVSSYLTRLRKVQLS
jgi:hypothetical protein